MMRNYEALEPRPGVTRTDQLKVRGNFMVGDQLFLVRCIACAAVPVEEGGRGRENWAPNVATGTCAWCDWPNPTEGEAT